MTKEKDANGKILIIGGGIANFTNVAATFKVDKNHFFLNKILFNYSLGNC
jgi:hypothetical protein